jgi:hypothetical protein
VIKTVIVLYTTLAVSETNGFCLSSLMHSPICVFLIVNNTYKSTSSNLARHSSKLTHWKQKIQVTKNVYPEGRRKFDTYIDTVKADIQLHKM